MDDAIARRKAALRATARAARQRLGPGARARASASAVQRLRELPEVAEAATVLLYAATRDEVDLAGLVAVLRERGARTLFPRVRGDDLELVVTTDLRSLEPGFRGIREPSGPRVDPGYLDVALVPGVAFDPTGGRLGQGGGHYDRLLPSVADNCVRIGVCFSCQVVPHVPRGDHDEPVDLVVTENATYRPTATRGGRGSGGEPDV